MKTLLFLILLPFVAAAQTVNVTFTWDKNPEPDVYDYIIKVGTATGVYSLPAVPVLGAIQKTVPLAPLANGGVYYVVVCAVNSSGLVSAPSEEKAFQVFTAGNGKVPSAPKKLEKPLNMQASIQTSKDLIVWERLGAKQDLPPLAKLFVRTFMEPKTE